MAIDQGWVCRAENTDSWEAFSERVFARSDENMYLKRDETYYGLLMLKLDQVYASTADHVDDAEQNC